VRPFFEAVNRGIGVSANGGLEAAVSGINIRAPGAHRPWADIGGTPMPQEMATPGFWGVVHLPGNQAAVASQ
jgi:hypothetical protein